MTAPTPLPRLLVLTDRRQASRPLPELLRAAVAGVVAAGAAPDTLGVVLREKDLPRARRAALAADLRHLVEVLLVASDTTIPGDGVHLAAADPLPAARPRLLGRSCHDLAEVARAAAEGCDYATLSPVLLSASKPGHGPPLGLDGLRQVVAAAGLPIYALGGIGPGHVAACLAAGAHGVAVQGAVMRADDPAGVVVQLVAARAGREELR